jgi:hypothetical protein
VATLDWATCHQPICHKYATCWMLIRPHDCHSTPTMCHMALPTQHLPRVVRPCHVSNYTDCTVNKFFFCLFDNLNRMRYLTHPTSFIYLPQIEQDSWLIDGEESCKYSCYSYHHLLYKLIYLMRIWS